MEEKEWPTRIKEVAVIGTHERGEILYEEGDELSELKRKLGTKEEQQREARLKKISAEIEKCKRKRLKREAWIAKLEKKGRLGAIGIKILRKL